MKSDKKCKHCKERFKPYNSMQKFCFNEECTKVWIETEKAKQWVKRKKELKDEIETVQSLMKKAQKVFNEFIRLRDDDVCISCEKPLGDKYDAGHYIASTYKVHTFNENNVHSQCVHCNQYQSGNLLEYRERLIEKIGSEAVWWLENTKHDEYKPTREELKQLIEEYKQKVKDLK